jgi:hypothetical protein
VSNVKKFLQYAAIAFVIFYLIKSPAGAAHVVHSAASGLASAARDLSTFVNSLTA